MRDAVLRLLACPSCGHALALDSQERAADGHVMKGTLHCAGCSTYYSIRNGVPRLVAGSAADSIETAARFAEEWKTFDHMSDYQEQWLRNWLAPLGSTDFKGKVVLEGGCGKGRHTVVMASWGVSHIVALDLGESVEIAFAHTRHLPNAHVVQGDILHPPVKRVFDIAFSIGVLHHLPEPRAGFNALREQVKSGGKIAIWVYGYESNEWIVRFVNPLRERITARLPPGLLYWLSLPPSAVLNAVLPVYKREKFAKHLPYCDYMSQLAQVPFREVHSIVYDQLVTPIAYYIPRDEVRSWFEVEGLKNATLEWHNKNSWRASAVVR